MSIQNTKDLYKTLEATETILKTFLKGDGQRNIDMVYLALENILDIKTALKYTLLPD